MPMLKRLRAKDLLREIELGRVYVFHGAMERPDPFPYVVRSADGDLRLNARGVVRTPEEGNSVACLGRDVPLDAAGAKLRAPLMAYALSGNASAIDDGYTNQSTRSVAAFVIADERAMHLLVAARANPAEGALTEELCRVALRPFVRANRHAIFGGIAMHEVQWVEVAHAVCQACEARKPGEQRERF